MAERTSILPWHPDDEATAARAGAARIDTSVPHPARVYNYWLGGKDNFEADRKVAEATAAVTPEVVQGARDSRAFLGRAVRFLAQHGIKQFLDIGTGIPTKGNVHEVAQQITPEARIVYVDNDPIVMTHARALLNSSPEGKTAYIEADMRDPQSILRHPDTTATLDFNEPIAVVIVGTLMFLKDEDDPFGVVKQFTDAVVPGSYLAITHVSGDFHPERMAAAAKAYNTGPTPFIARPGTEIMRFFEGFELVEPGLVAVHEWRPDPGTDNTNKIAGAYAGVGRKL